VALLLGKCRQVDRHRRTCSSRVNNSSCCQRHPQDLHWAHISSSNNSRSIGSSNNYSSSNSKDSSSSSSKVVEVVQHLRVCSREGVDL
jgi:hypothetical protein